MLMLLLTMTGNFSSIFLFLFSFSCYSNPQLKKFLLFSWEPRQSNSIPVVDQASSTGSLCLHRGSPSAEARASPLTLHMRPTQQLAEWAREARPNSPSQWSAHIWTNTCKHQLQTNLLVHSASKITRSPPNENSTRITTSISANIISLICYLINGMSIPLACTEKL